MSFMRKLAPNLGGPSSSRVEDIKLKFIVPSHGSVFINPPQDDPLWPLARSAGPREDHIFSGLLEVAIPPGAARRAKSVRVGLRTTASLKMSPERGWEEDVIFERKVELLGGNAEGMLLDEGVQRFEFTLILPSTLASHDWHHDAKLRQVLYAEVSGSAPPPSSGIGGVQKARGRGSWTSLSSYKDGHSKSPQRSPVTSPRMPSPRLPTESLSITRQEDPSISSERAPEYEETDTHQHQQPNGIGSGDVGINGQGQGKGLGQAQGSTSANGGATKNDWIVGTREVTRNIMVLHNPHPNAGVSNLDERQSGYAPHLGPWSLRIASDYFSIGSPVYARLTLNDPSPRITIFYARLLTRQTHTVRSPRDPPGTQPISSSRSFANIVHGTRPPQGVKYPGKHQPAIWRGVEAAGSDMASIKVEGNGLMPKDDRARPTTLPGIISPIHVSHTLVYELFFSVWGEDENGRSLSKLGPGGLRVLQIERQIILPSCMLIPSALNLPEYYSIPCDIPCPTCGMQRRDQVCSTCPPTIVPHPRHDHPFSRVGNKDGVCPKCSEGISVNRDYNGAWDICACGEDVKAIEERMGRFVLDTVRAEAEENERVSAMNFKESAEREDSSSMDLQRPSLGVCRGSSRF